MAKSKNQEETRTSIDDLNDQLTAVGAKVQANQKAILVATLIVAAIVAGICIWFYAIYNPAKERANNAVGAADYELLVAQNDSTALAGYQAAVNEGKDAGNRAALLAAIKLYENGNYEEALAYTKKYSAKDDIIGAAAYSLQGDCYVNLDQLDNAVGSFKKAISQSDDNAFYTPFFMLKLARVYDAQGNYAAEVDLYKKILADYPQYAETYGVDIEKMLAYAELQAAKK